MTTNTNTYAIPAALINKLIWSIIIGIVTIGGYMVAWGINDAKFKVQVITELQYLKERVVEIGEDQDRHEHEDHSEVRKR